MSVVTQSKAKKQKKLHTSRGTSHKSETRKSAERDSQRANAALATLIYGAARTSEFESESESKSESERLATDFDPNLIKYLNVNNNHKLPNLMLHLYTSIYKYIRMCIYL